MTHLLAGYAVGLQLEAMQSTLEQHLAAVPQAQLLLLLLACPSQLEYVPHAMIRGAALTLVSFLAQRAEIESAADAVIGGLRRGSTKVKVLLGIY